MNISHAASRGEWLAARLDLSAKEKAASRQLAAVAKQRRALPAVAIDKDNVFEGPDGRVGLIDLFNCDFHVSNDESIAPIEYNYKDKATRTDGQGVSVFVQDDGKVFHTYSAYGVGADVMLSTYRFLDLTPLGRQRYINEWPWHDTYGAPDHHEHHQ